MTSEVSVYHIPYSQIKKDLFEYPSCINIIDTPGFNDTRGFEWDRKIEAMIKGLLHKLDHLDYITITIKSTENRLTPPTKFVYETIYDMYGVDLKDRVLAMITFAFDTDTKCLMQL